MGKESSQSRMAGAVDVTAVADPAPGGVLGEFVEYLKSLGRAAALSRDGKYAWVSGVKGELQRFPLECNEPVEAAEIRGILCLPNIRLVSYLLSDDKTHLPNCFDYVCCDSNYHIENLSSHARRDIRRGLRNFTVRLCTWPELAEKGLPAHVETTTRHGYAEPDPGWLDEMIKRQQTTPFYEIWGAWQEDDLAAWMTIIKIDDWAIIDIARSCTDALKWCPNNALAYEATRRLLVEEKRRYVTYGLSSIQVDVNERSMHKYKVRMGYEPIPMCRIFEVKALLRPMLRSPLMSWTWEKLAKVFPKSSSLRKLAGMSRILSGREESPLAWADRQE